MSRTSPEPPLPRRLEADVAIVGVGPVGLLLANLLVARGLRTLLFDKRTEPQASSMAIGITPPSLEILKRLSLDGVFRDAGVPVRHAEVFEASTRVGRLDFAGIASEYPFFLSLPQARTVEILRSNLAGLVERGKAGEASRIHDGYEFRSFVQDADGVTAAFRSVNSETCCEVRARFLVGADGHKSAVRAAAGLRVREKTYPQRFLMADFEDDSGLGVEARLFFTAEASVESFPLPGGYRRWIVQVNDAPEEAPVELLTSRVQRLTGFDLSRCPARFVSAFGAKRMVVEQYHAGRVLLAGDSAHVMSSIGGQGMNTGFADAEMLAEILPVVLHAPRQMPRCFAAYDRIRRRSFEVAATRAERGMWLGTKRGRLASWCRKHFIRDVLFSPWLAHRLAPHFAMLTVPYRNLNWLPHDWLAAD
jgi:2-polyprenyl-6-methoxyphenol hydroxylase-like FAD-dependent oxidoreductase